MLADGVTPTYTLNVSVTDDQVLKYLEILIEGLPDYSPLRVMADGKGELNFSKKIELTNEVKDYKMTFTAVDNTDKSTVVKSVLSVSELQDFEKMYLADTDDLTNDVLVYRWLLIIQAHFNIRPVITIRRRVLKFISYLKKNLLNLYALDLILRTKIS